MEESSGERRRFRHFFKHMKQLMLEPLGISESSDDERDWQSEILESFEDNDSTEDESQSQEEISEEDVVEGLQGIQMSEVDSPRARANWRKISKQAVTVNKVVRNLDGESEENYAVTAAWFLGPKAENLKFLRELLNHALDEHAEFRRYKYFPLDPEYICSNIKQQPSYRKAQKKMRREFDVLSERMKNSVPFFNFRSQGHMLWDTTIASNVGYIGALLYNQNNVSSMASSVTLQLEREVSQELCRMVGYNATDKHIHSTQSPKAWGHLPNGGTVANMEAMWAARCLKYNALAIKTMLLTTEDPRLTSVRETFEFRMLDGSVKLLMEGTAWELLNIPIDHAIDLFNDLLTATNQNLGEEECAMKEDHLFSLVKEHTIEELGVLDFFQNLAELDIYNKYRMGKWFVPGSRHYSWDKGENILGMGRRNLVKVSVDRDCRMDIHQLADHLKACAEANIPVIGVTAVFGTTQEGAVDDLVAILELRRQLEQSHGLTFYVHVDGAWGGYFASTMWTSRHQLLAKKIKRRRSIESDNHSFPSCRLSSYFEKQLRALKHANSITLDPHKTGFCPYPAGGLLYRNGNIRTFLAQKAAYVNHGETDNEEINLYGIDGSKPGAASAAVWLSHRVIGLHNTGYGFLLRQCSFSGGIMYAVWASMERPEDPFTIVPAIRIKKQEGQARWTKKRLRKEILDADNINVNSNELTMEFIEENGPDTLINCLSANLRFWDGQTGGWKLNEDLSLQGKFLEAFYTRCSHSIEKPSMVDRGIQIILNSTYWEKSTHGAAYKDMQEQLGLSLDEEGGKIKMIINTCMSPWLRLQQKTFKRMSVIIRNEFYNAYGAVTDRPRQLDFVSPCAIHSDKYIGWEEDGFLFAELEASFSKQAQEQSYHAIGLFCVRPEDREAILALSRAGAELAAREVREGRPVKYLPLKFRTLNEMTLFDLMTGRSKVPTTEEECHENEEKQTVEVVDGAHKKFRGVSFKRTQSMKEKLEKYSDQNLCYADIHFPEMQVEFSIHPNLKKTAKIKLRKVIRYHHLLRDLVDENDYPPTQEYILYSFKQHAYISHCPNRFPDFQQLVELDEVPVPAQEKSQELYQEALSRGVIVYLPQIECGGKPLMKTGFTDRCRDPLDLHLYNAVSWTDQGAFTGDMISIHLSLKNHGKRWFDGTNINKQYNISDYPMFFNEDGSRRVYMEDEDEQEDDVYEYHDHAQ